MACFVFSLVVFLSFCIPRGGVGTGCVWMHVFCLRTSDCLCLFVIGFRDVICDLTSLMCVCHFVVCLAIVCVYISVCVPVCCFVVASPWTVFLFPGGAARAGGQALHHAGQCRAAPEHAGQAEEALWGGDRSSAGKLDFT